jgi:putative ABC transport system substrate-binding protein
MIVRAALAGALALGLLVEPIAAEAQPAKNVRLGYLSSNPPSDTEAAMDAFRKRLRDFGYIEGQNLVIDSRYAEGRFEKLPELAAEFARLRVDVIFVYGTPASLAVRNSTLAIPVVFAGVNDPLTIGLVQSLRQPGGNVTGVTTNNSELSAKRLSLLKQAVPTASRVAVLANPDFKPSSSMLSQMQLAAQPLGLHLHVVEARKADELPAAFSRITAVKPDALVVLPDPWLLSQRRRVVELVTNARVPAMYHLRQYLEVGGLMAYGPSYTESFRQGAVLVDKILKGTAPRDLPVEQPWTFEFIVNLKAARALGLTVPPSVLLRADEVIE